MLIGLYMNKYLRLRSNIAKDKMHDDVDGDNSKSNTMTHCNWHKSHRKDIIGR